MLGFPDGSGGQESTCNAGDLGSIPGLGRPPGEGTGYPLWYSGLENAVDRGAWHSTVHVGCIPYLYDLCLPGGSDCKESSYNAGDPGSIPGLGRLPWSRKWQPTLVFLPGKFHGQRRLEGSSLWGLENWT